MSKRKRSGRQRPHSSDRYRQAIQQADQVLFENGVDLRSGNWQELALEWFASEEPDCSDLLGYMAEHESRLGLVWARDLLRLEVLLHSGDQVQIVTHFDRAFPAYPRCALVELWVADHVWRYSGGIWRARQMYRYALEHLPRQAKPRYELGFMAYLLGDFPGALDWFNQAAAIVADDDIGLGAQIFYNLAIVRYYLEGDKKAAVADLEEALRRRPDYEQAQQALRGLKGTLK